MSLLAIDVGNTQTHIGYFEGGALRENWRVATDASATGDELALALAGLFELRGMPLAQTGATIVSSVVPRLGAEYSAMSARYLDHEALIVGPAVRTGMPIRTDAPHELGADRIVNAVAAYERFGEACVVVDFGTAITYDAISPRGEYLGGIIAPGIEISIEALARRAAKLPEVELAEPATVVGRNTHDSIQAGVVYGFAGQIDGIVARMRAELGEATAVIATGGQAPAIARFCGSIDEVDEMLTLTGLLLIYERNLEEVGA